MNKDQKRPRGESLKTFATFPLADNAAKNTVDNATIPSVEAVTEAKEWVDFNEK